MLVFLNFIDTAGDLCLEEVKIVGEPTRILMALAIGSNPCRILCLLVTPEPTSHFLFFNHEFVYGAQNKNSKIIGVNIFDLVIKVTV